MTTLFSAPLFLAACSMNLSDAPISVNAVTTYPTQMAEIDESGKIIRPEEGSLPPIDAPYPFVNYDLWKCHDGYCAPEKNVGLLLSPKNHQGNARCQSGFAAIQGYDNGRLSTDIHCIRFFNDAGFIYQGWNKDSILSMQNDALVFYSLEGTPQRGYAVVTHTTHVEGYQHDLTDKYSVRITEIDHPDFCQHDSDHTNIIDGAYRSPRITAQDRPEKKSPPSKREFSGL